MKSARASSDRLGTGNIPKLIRELSIPSAIGILVLSINGIVDTIFVGRYIGALGIASLTVVLPFTFLLANLGMATGVGGASIISRSLGAGNRDRALHTFHNQLLLTGSLISLGVLIGFLFQDNILRIFGAQSDIIDMARTYLQIWLYGVPVLAFGMMSNSVFRAEGKPNISMIVMLVPAVINLILDPIFIIYLDWGIQGAGWATTIAHLLCGLAALAYFISDRTELSLPKAWINVDWKIIKEIASLGGVTFARSSVISILAIVLNNTLYQYGGNIAISVYGIIQRIMFFIFFPIIGLVQGFLPIVGYNYGAQLYSRVRETLHTSLIYATIISCLILVGILFGADLIIGLFTTDTALIEMARPALRITFYATPILAIQLFGSAYYQAIGKAVPALLLTLTKQGFCLIPLLFILPSFMGLEGIWWSFPLADLTASFINAWFLYRAYKKLY